MKTVAVAGYFDPLHEGHYHHLMRAKEYGEFLIVIVGTDYGIFLKRGTPSLMSQKARMSMLLALPWVDGVVKNIDLDGTCARTLELIRPNVFVKGGDRTLENMPRNELRACKKIGCEIVYGVGETLNSSTKIIKNLNGGRI